MTVQEVLQNAFKCTYNTILYYVISTIIGLSDMQVSEQWALSLSIKYQSCTWHVKQLPTLLYRAYLL